MTISANYPNVRPALLLDFSNQTVLDPRVTFARTTTALYYDNKSAALAEQNLLLQSNTFTTTWTRTGIDTPVVGATDPAGGATGYTVTASVGSSQHYLQQLAITSAPVGTYTYSVYLQAGAGAGSTTYASLVTGNATAYVTATFNLSSTGSVTQSSTSGYTLVGTSITQIGSTAWYRCSVTYTSSSALAAYVWIQPNSVSTYTPSTYGMQAAWTALGTETLLIYGAQLEQRSSPTVYTATTATAVNTYTPTLQTAAINSPRFDYNPTTRESLGLLLEQASTNNQLYSSNFDNAAWTKTQTSITTAADISPDGTQNAQLMTLSTTSAAHTLVSANFATYATSTTYTVSIYAKAYGSTSRYITFGVTRGSNDLIGALCNFDLVGGTAGTALIGSSSGYIASATSNIQSVGNGWYRCSVTYTTSSGGGYIINMYVVASNTATTSITFPSFAGNGFDGYLLWGAQYETTRSATSYIANTSVANARTVDSASMTGTNFTSWYNYSGGTLYLELSIANVSAATSMIGITDSASSINSILMQTLTAGAGFQNYVVSPSTSAAINAYLPASATLANNAFSKSVLTYSVTGVTLVGGGGTVATTANNPLPPSVNQLLLASPPVGPYGTTNIINGRIKKFAYYPLALTNTQIQSLSAN